MVEITYRVGKGSALTYEELDNNFLALSILSTGAAIFKTREELVAWQSSGSTYDDGTVFYVQGIGYQYKTIAPNVITDLPNFLPVGSLSIRHFGVKESNADNSDQFQAMLNYMSAEVDPTLPINNAETTNATLEHIRSTGYRNIDLEGGKYLLSKPLYIGKFDFNQDGIYEYGCGPIFGVNFTNGTLQANSEGTWTEKLDNDDVGNYMIYIGVVSKDDYLGIIDTVTGIPIDNTARNSFHVGRIEFNDVEIDGGFVTGGIYAENTYRVQAKNSIFRNMGPGCHGVDTGVQTGTRPRGLTKNQETVIDTCRFEGNYRIDGITDWPGDMTDFDDQAYIALSQTPTNSNLTLNGVGIENNEWVSSDEIPHYVMIKNAFYEFGNYMADLSGVNFTVTGFADVNRTIPLTEVIPGPLGGSKPTFSYGNKRFAVITSISCDTNVVDPNANVTVSLSYNNSGIRIRVHDFYISNCIFTTFPRAMDIHGRAGQVYGNHPWSREIRLRSNANKINFFGNYFDYTDIIVEDNNGRFVHQLNGNSFQIGSASLFFVTSTPNTSFDGTVLTGNIFTDYAGIEYRTIGSGSFETPSKIKQVGNVFENWKAIYPETTQEEFNGARLTQVSDPVDDQDAVTKIYADTEYYSKSGGLINGNVYIGDGTNTGAEFYPTGYNAMGRTSPGQYLQFKFNNQTGIGNISTDGTSVSYNTTSDRRVKEISGEVIDASSRLNEIKIYNGKILGSDKDIHFVIADELQQIIPYAVTGEPNAEEDGVPVYQSVDYSKIVPLLIAAINEATNEIKELKSKL